MKKPHFVLKYRHSFIAILFSIFCGTLFPLSNVDASAPSKSSAPTASAQKIRSGDTVYSILRKFGFSDTQRNQALAGAQLPDSFVLSPGQSYLVRRSPDGVRVEILFFAHNSPAVYSFWRAGRTDAGGDMLDPEFSARVARVSGAVRGSLVQSISSLIKDDLVAYRFMDAFLLDYDLPRTLQRGARFSIAYEKLYFDDIFIRNGEVLEAAIEIGDKMVNRRFVKTRDGGIFLDSNYRHEDRLLYAPVNYVRISSLFQPRRMHPIKKRYIAHLGIDFEADEGVPVYSSAAGTILRFGRNRAAGNYVVLRHKSGYETYYNHLHELSPKLRTGANIKAGVLIGSIGCTGYCTKPHLHFALKKHGKFINPIRHLRFYSYPQKNKVNKLLAQNE